jgi:hypothetical protein
MDADVRLTHFTNASLLPFSSGVLGLLVVKVTPSFDQMVFAWAET